MKQELLSLHILTTARMLLKLGQRNFPKLGLGPGQMAQLLYILENPGSCQEDLSTELEVDRTTITKSLKKLEERGFVIRERDPKDQRYNRLMPTDKAREVQPHMLAAIQQHESLLHLGLSKDELESTIAVLERIHVNLTEAMSSRS